MADSKNDVNAPSHFTYTWKIENISFPCYAKSPIFTVEGMEMTKWHLEIGNYNSEFFDLTIWRLRDDGPYSMEIKFELSFLGIDGLHLIEKEHVKNFENKDFFNFHEFAEKHEVFFRRRSEFLPKDALTVRCRMWRTRTEIAELDSCFARTRLRPDRRVFVWAIREFSALKRDQERKILLNITSNNEFSFIVFVTENDGEEYVSISAQDSEDEWFAVEISLLDFEGKVVHSEEGTWAWRKKELKNFLKISRLVGDKESLLPNDVLSLRCEVEREANAVWSVIENNGYFNFQSFGLITTDKSEILHSEPDNTSNVPSSFTENMKSLLEEGTLSDVSLRAGSKSFAAHKCILSARSPVFKAMFNGDMREKTSKCVEIPDVDEDTLRELLSYIYTDMVGELEWRGAADLYRAADKYELLDLKSQCATILKSDLSVSSVCTVLVVADLHRDPELREAAEDFIMRQGAEFFSSDTWRDFKVENSVLALDIVERILCSMKRQ